MNNDSITLILKFGFNQNRFEFRLNNDFMNFVGQVYRTSEKWILDILSIWKDPPFTGLYQMYLFVHRNVVNEFRLAPLDQFNGIQQNSMVEVCLVPTETNGSPHALRTCRDCQFGHCARCFHSISMNPYKCSSCSKMFHKHCLLSVFDGCHSRTSEIKPLLQPNLEINHPYKNRPQTKPESRPSPLKLPPKEVDPTSTVIAKGVFLNINAGEQLCHRRAFFLTKDRLLVTSNVTSVIYNELPKQTNNDIDIPLLKIRDIKLTHFDQTRDDIFEIQCHNGLVLSVGKKYENDTFQMEAAQFYSWILDQWQSSLNSTPLPTSSTPSKDSNTPVNIRTPLAKRKSSFRIPPKNIDDESLDLYELYTLTGEIIGEGQFGRVVAAIRKSDRERVAIKVIQKNNCDENEIKRIHSEINILYKINHMNTLKLEAYFEFPDSVYLVTERLNTDMCQYIVKSPHGYLDEHRSRVLIYQVLVALRYLDTKNCGHLDIKCENILLGILKSVPNPNEKLMEETVNYDTDHVLVKLADFGYSQIIGENSFRKTRVGTKVYNAPEMNKGPIRYNRSVDMWSLGMVLYAALSGKLPYDESDVLVAEHLIENQDNLFSDPVWNSVSREGKQLITEKLLVIDPTRRIRPNDAMFEDWFTDYPLYETLRAIEHKVSSGLGGPNAALLAHWLTNEREDEVWTAYGLMYAEQQ